VKGIKDRPISLQINGGYFYNLYIFNNVPRQIGSTKVNGLALSTELRNYTNVGFFYGPYVQYNNINADVALDFGYLQTTIKNNKTSTSIGFLIGYVVDISKRLGLEFTLGGGRSNTKFIENGQSVNSFRFTKKPNKDFLNMFSYDDALLEKPGKQLQLIYSASVTYILAKKND
jgi:Protein of unknown function (DUF3575)